MIVMESHLGSCCGTLMTELMHSGGIKVCNRYVNRVDISNQQIRESYRRGYLKQTERQKIRPNPELQSSIYGKKAHAPEWI